MIEESRKFEVTEVATKIQVSAKHILNTKGNVTQPIISARLTLNKVLQKDSSEFDKQNVFPVRMKVGGE